MDNIKEIIKDVIGKMAEKKPKDDEKVERIWKNILNREELKHTHLSGIKNNSLFVNVDSPAWLYQMKIRKTTILERLHTEIPDIKNISFKIGKIK